MTRSVTIAKIAHSVPTAIPTIPDIPSGKESNHDSNLVITNNATVP